MIFEKRLYDFFSSPKKLSLSFSFRLSPSFTIFNLTLSFHSSPFHPFTISHHFSPSLTISPRLTISQFQITPGEEYFLRRNKCNCLTYQLKLGYIGVLAFFFLMLLLSFPFIKKSSVVNIIIVICVWASFFTCCGISFVLCCPCCKTPAGDED
jgi:hypothetical protein